MPKIRFLLLLFSFATGLYGQSEPDTGVPLRVGLSMMGNTYSGDMTGDTGEFIRFNPGGSLSLQFAGKSALQPMLTAGYGRFREQLNEFLIKPPAGVEPNTFVETNFFFTDLRMQFFFRKERDFQPYLSAGIGMLFFSPLDQDGNFLGENIFTRLEEEYYNTTVATFPLTVGMHLAINEVISVRVDYTQRFTTTDYLDNIGLLGSKAGNDALRHFQVGVFFTLLPREEMVLPPPASPYDLPLEIIAFEPEVNRAATLMVPDQLVLPESPAAGRSDRLASLIKEDLLRLHKQAENQSDSPAVSSVPTYLAQQSQQEAAAIAAGRYIYYAVKKTDRLEKVAQQFGVSPGSILQLNQSDLSQMEDQVYLRIPDVRADHTPAAPADTSATDSLSLNKEGFNWLALEQAALERDAYLFLFVSRKEHLADLARRYHLRLQTILDLNYLTDPQLKADTYLRLPDTGFIE